MHQINNIEKVKCFKTIIFLKKLRMTVFLVLCSYVNKEIIRNIYQSIISNANILIVPF